MATRDVFLSVSLFHISRSILHALVEMGQLAVPFSPLVGDFSLKELPLGGGECGREWPRLNYSGTSLIKQQGHL